MIQFPFKNKGKMFIFLSLMFAGFAFRVFLSTFAVKDIKWDMWSFHENAIKIMGGEMVADCCMKNMGYSIFLAGIYRIFGPENILALSVVQAALDTLAALLIFLAVRNRIRGKVAFISFAAYLFNPFTSAYTGLRLAEIVTFFYVSAIAYILSFPTFTKRKVLWFLLGTLLGLLLFTRMQFLLFSFGLIGFFALFLFGGFDRLKFMLVSLAGFLLMSSYSLLTYHRTYGLISLVAPYTVKYSALYVNLYNDVRYQETNIIYPPINPIRREILLSYYAVRESDFRLIPEFEEKYKKIYFSSLIPEWKGYATSYFRNLIWIWDKYYFFLYYDMFYPKGIMFTRGLNIILIILFFLGMVSYAWKNRRRVSHDALFVFSAGLFFYISFTFPLVSNENRHTLSYYPVMILFAGMGIRYIAGKFFI